MQPKVPFSKLNNDIQLAFSTIPSCVSVTKNPDNETWDHLLKRQTKLLSLSESTKTKLVSDKTGEEIQKIGTFFKLTLFQMADIARTVRSYYFGEIKLEDIAPILAKEIPIDIVKAREIARMVIEKIINDNSQEQAYQARLENITIQEALKNYPELGEQLITSEKITLKTFHDPVRPSIKNWLTDYTFTMGHDPKSAIERGNYIFQSVNGRRLSSGERQKLAYILKAHDENNLITVDKNAKQIVFPTVNIAPAKTISQQSTNYKSQNPNKTQIQSPKPSMQNVNEIAASRSLSAKSELPRNDNYIKPQINNLAAPRREFVRNDNYQISQLKENTVETEPRDETNIKNAPLHNNMIAAVASLPRNDSNIKFSSPQRLPFEREKKQEQQKDMNKINTVQPPAKPAIPTPPKPQPRQNEPLRIRPFSMGWKEDGVPSKNVVNLKEDI